MTPDQARILSNPPPHDEGVRILTRAYSELATEKPVGMVLGPIPLSIIWAWCDRHLPGSPLEAERFHRIMRRVDNTFLLRQAAARAAPK